MEFTEEYKKKIEKMIVDTAIDGLGAEAIKESDLQAIAEFVLSRIDSIKNTQELEEFLKELVEKWKFFGPIEKYAQGEEQHNEEQRSVHTAEDLVKSGNIDEALQVLKATEKGVV